jgi:glycosyltransferase involved in cell wall biosynthesis
MLYVPGLFKHWDGRLLERAVLKRLRTQVSGGPLDLIDAHFGYPDGVGAVRAAGRLGLPAFVTVRGLETDYLRDPAIAPQLIDALKQAAGCISVSHSLKTLVTGHGVPEERVRVIPNAVDRSAFFPGEKSEARARLGIASDDALIVSVGTMIALKRHHVVIQALAELRKWRPGATLAIIGMERDEPEYTSGLRKLAEDLGVLAAVRFVGAVPPDEVARWLTAANVFCLVSAREGCCNAVLEALACGRPVVTTSVGDNAHFVVEGSNGYLVPVDDVVGTARALAEALVVHRWDPQSISSTLPIGSWDDVAHQVVDFFRERLAISGGCPILNVSVAS